MAKLSSVPKMYWEVMWSIELLWGDELYNHRNELYRTIGISIQENIVSLIKDKIRD